MKIIALSCTQKKLPSITDAVLEVATAGFLSEEPDAQVVPIRLIDHNIQMCEGEDSCLDPAIGRCVLVDDYEEIVSKAVNADGMILSMPVYGGNVPAILKIFQERLKSYMHQDKRPFGGLSVCTIVHARNVMTESAVGALGPWYARLKNKNVVSVSFTQAGLQSVQDVMRTKVPELCHAAGEQLALSLRPSKIAGRPYSAAAPAIPLRTGGECGQEHPPA